MFERQEGRHVHDPWEDVIIDTKGTLTTNAITGEAEERITTYEVLAIRLNIQVEQFGDLERGVLRPSNVHSADGWEGGLKGDRHRDGRHTRARDLLTPHAGSPESTSQILGRLALKAASPSAWTA
jgi:hypothetical protein